MGCCPVDFQEVKRRPLETKSGKRPIKIGQRPIKEGKRSIKAMVLVGISAGCLTGCFRAPQPRRKTAPLKTPIKRSMSLRENQRFASKKKPFCLWPHLSHSPLRARIAKVSPRYRPFPECAFDPRIASPSYENNSDHPHPPYLRKYAPKICHVVGGPAVFCEDLRFQSGFLRFPAPCTCLKFQEKGWICEDLRFSAKIFLLGSGCHLSFVPKTGKRNSRTSTRFPNLWGKITGTNDLAYVSKKIIQGGQEHLKNALQPVLGDWFFTTTGADAPAARHR